MDNCPKCGAAIGIESAVECPRCGVVFAKLHVHDTAPAVERAVAPPPAIDVAASAAQHASGIVRVAQIVTLAGLAIWTVSLARAGMGTTAEESFLHLPNLVFHEAGHVVFGFCGRFITVLGGSLFQFLVPLICAGAFIREKNVFAAAVCTWWAGENLLDLAPYIADARALQLVLIGGHTGAEVEGHDWEYLLTQLGWLHRDVALGLAAHRIGLLMMAASLVCGGVALRRSNTE
jgi:hypothetical protein